MHYTSIQNIHKVIDPLFKENEGNETLKKSAVHFYELDENFVYCFGNKIKF